MEVEGLQSAQLKTWEHKISYMELDSLAVDKLMNEAG